MSLLARNLRRHLNLTFICQKSDNSKETAEKILRDFPEEPTACCMQGCPNCVWLDYAEKLNEYFKDGGEQSIKEIEKRVSDENIKAYLLHELRMRMKSNKS